MGKIVGFYFKSLSILSEESGALTKKVVAIQTSEPEESDLIYSSNLVYIYMLTNGNFYVGSTNRTILKRTSEHVKDEDFKIKEILGIILLKNQVPVGENCASLESKIHFSLAKSLDLSVEKISHSKPNGFKCNGFILANCVMGLFDFQYYKVMTNTELKELNQIFRRRNLISHE